MNSNIEHGLFYFCFGVVMFFCNLFVAYTTKYEHVRSLNIFCMGVQFALILRMAGILWP